MVIATLITSDQSRATACDTAQDLIILRLEHQHSQRYCRKVLAVENSRPSAPSFLIQRTSSRPTHHGLHNDQTTHASSCSTTALCKRTTTTTVNPPRPPPRTTPGDPESLSPRNNRDSRARIPMQSPARANAHRAGLPATAHRSPPSPSPTHRGSVAAARRSRSTDRTTTRRGAELVPARARLRRQARERG
jgi:hypothetical protein